MNPLDTDDRVADLRKKHGIGLCNITKCCTKVCPENIHITDNGIIPLKERVVDRVLRSDRQTVPIFEKIGQSHANEGTEY